MIDAVSDPLEALTGLLRDGQPWTSVSNFLSAARLLRSVSPESAGQRATATLRIAVIGNATTDYIVSAIELALAPRLACTMYSAGFDQWTQELLSPDSGLAVFAADVVVVLLSTLGLTAGGARYPDVDAAFIRGALTAFSSRSSAAVVTILPELPVEATGGGTEADRWYHRTRGCVETAVTEASARGLAIDPMPVLGDLARSWHASSYWGSAKLPYHPAGCIAVGRRVAQAIENISVPRVKVVAVDCDDTLWGGIAGEVGAAGVNLSPFDAGIAHLRLQRLLKEAARSGILLVAVSKNDPATVAAVFRERAADMLLTADDFVAFKVGWGPKSEALREAAADLRLGLDAFMFLDDSPFERGEVRSGTPDVLVPELPQNPEEYAAFVSRLGVLERPITTDEDRQRTNLYKQEQSRDRALLDSGSLETYLASLDLHVTAVRIGAGTIDRATQLIAKTNQFNLTTRRYAREELAALAADPSAYAYSFHVRDRFGDAGLIGVVIATERDRNEIAIDAFLMSCRVMGRMIELAMFEHLRRWSRARHRTRIQATYLRSSKNAMVADLLPQLGFGLTAENPGRAEYARNVLPPVEVRFASIDEGG